ncbi:Dolichol-phosphate mannose synthase subunit 2 [Vitis vinifera]|uniref:Dolichol phosphate-mannose biosynthesis regulatory protein n=1 Tax=Vitis vinifera TaxID=29760 RepID=A0A438C8N0_VITVI|nr:Dolichol-phosphate mannose synthase subunit 2 [Vitis vinifera]
MYKDANVLTMGLQAVEAVSQNGISRQSGWVSIIFYQHIHIHLLYLLGHHPDSDHFIHKYFLPQDYAILIPVFAGVTLLCFLCTFVGFVMLKSKQKAK